MFAFLLSATLATSVPFALAVPSVLLHPMGALLLMQDETTSSVVTVSGGSVTADAITQAFSPVITVASSLPATSITSIYSVPITLEAQDPRPTQAVSASYTVARSRYAFISPDFAGLSDPARAPQTIEMTATKVGETTPYLIQNVPATGAVYRLELPQGFSYKITMKPGTWLRREFTVNLVASDDNAAPILINGDANGDNEVGPGDFAVLAGAFGSFLGDPGYLENADFNRDDEVGPADFAILASAFGEFGD